MPQDTEKRQEEIGRLLYFQNLYNQQYDALMNELTTFNVALTALERNLTLLNKKGDIEGSKILVSGEGGTYMEANVKDMKKVVTYVGAGYLVEKEIDKAKEFIQNNIQASRQTMEKLAGDKQKLEGELMKLQMAIDTMQQQSR